MVLALRAVDEEQQTFRATVQRAKGKCITATHVNTIFFSESQARASVPLEEREGSREPYAR